MNRSSVADCRVECGIWEGNMEFPFLRSAGLIKPSNGTHWGLMSILYSCMEMYGCSLRVFKLC